MAGLMNKHQRELFQGAAGVYAWIIPALQKAGRELGYSVAIHGSLGRDLDLICVPWIENAAPPMKLLKEFKKRVGGEIQGPSLKPHGRKGYVIVLNQTHFYLDISIMPKIRKKK